MSPKRGDRAAPPPVGTEYDLRFATAADDDGWEDLARQAAPNLRRAYDAIRANPRSTTITYAGAGHPKETD